MLHSNLTLDDLVNFSKPQIENKLIVKVETSYYKDKKGAVVYQRKIRPLKKKSTQDAMQWMWEDISCGGVDMFIKGIINFHSVDDGIYEMKMVGITHDFETGHVDGWDWKLFKINVDK